MINSSRFKMYSFFKNSSCLSSHLLMMIISDSRCWKGRIINKREIKNFKGKKNLILITHYVFISEVLNYGPSSGEIVVSDKNLNIIGSIEIDF